MSKNKDMEYVGPIQGIALGSFLPPALDRLNTEEQEIINRQAEVVRGELTARYDAKGLGRLSCLDIVGALARFMVRENITSWDQIDNPGGAGE